MDGRPPVTDNVAFPQPTPISIQTQINILKSQQPQYGNRRADSAVTKGVGKHIVTIIRNFTKDPVNRKTPRSYQATWQLLKDPYDKIRIMVATTVQRLLDQPSGASTLGAIKRLHGTTKECLVALLTWNFKLHFGICF
ncbi:hypothetical protein EVAR_72318_1 [Eumeta japonica]|uniref:Uncharacterized protein n=1 Tax=Eumeta variegata TaxID=151549 RepID=A0A4C1TSX1_EUMVA|nr:hypothetical protein EVAR_72318_1 [Eumeta japonica]